MNLHYHQSRLNPAMSVTGTLGNVHGQDGASPARAWAGTIRWKRLSRFYDDWGSRFEVRRRPVEPVVRGPVGRHCSTAGVDREIRFETESKRDFGS